MYLCSICLSECNTIYQWKGKIIVPFFIYRWRVLFSRPTCDFSQKWRVQRGTNYYKFSLCFYQLPCWATSSWIWGRSIFALSTNLPHFEEHSWVHKDWEWNTQQLWNCLHWTQKYTMSRVMLLNRWDRVHNSSISFSKPWGLTNTGCKAVWKWVSPGRSSWRAP